MLIGLAIGLLFVCAVTTYFRPGIGLLVAVAGSAALAAVSVLVEQSELLLAPPVILIAALLTAAIFSRETESNCWIRIFARRILLVILLLPFAALFFGLGGPFGALILALFVGAVISAAATSQTTTAAYVASTIGSAMRQNLPLPAALEMAAAGETRKRARMLLSIKKWLIEGYSLSEALKRGYPRCPAYAIALVRVGEGIGQAPQALAAVEQDLVAKVHSADKTKHSPTLYPPLLLLFMFLVVLWLMKFIMPKFEEMLRELAETGLPPATEVVCRIASFIAHGCGWVFWVLLIAAALFSAVFYVRIKSRPRRPDRPYLASRLGDYIKWHLPFVRWYEWNRGMQRVAEMLRLSLNAGCTANRAIANTLQADVNEQFRKGLREWLSRVERGEDVGEAAGRCGMGSAMAWAFGDMRNYSNGRDVLEVLEASYRWGYSRLAALARFIIGPCETICVGLIVGFVTYAIFAALVAIVYATAESIIP